MSSDSQERVHRVGGDNRSIYQNQRRMNDAVSHFQRFERGARV
jgi:hypothetical protein